MSNPPTFAPSNQPRRVGRVVSNATLPVNEPHPIVSNSERIRRIQRAQTQTPAPVPPEQQPPTPVKRRKSLLFRRIRAFFIIIILAALITGGFIVWDMWNTYNDLKDAVQRTDALSTMPDDATGAQTWLIVGNDGRSAQAESDVLGARADTIMLLIHSANGADSLVSIPRDTKVRIPEFTDEIGILGQAGRQVPLQMAKINAAYSYGGAKLLVRTVELFTALKIDHYVEVGFDGVSGVTDTLGGINLCYDDNVDDPDSGMHWVSGCKDVNGVEALAFSRMRYQDPIGDIGRTQRQHQVISKLSEKIINIYHAGDIWNLFNVKLLASIGKAALQYIQFDANSDIWTIKTMVESFQNASANLTLENSVIPIENPIDYDEILGSIVSVNGDNVRAWLQARATS